MAEPAAPKTAEEELLRMTAEVVSAYVSNNTLATGQLADVIQAVYNSLRGLEGHVSEPAAEALKPAVPIRKSVTPEYLVCLEDG
jgi:predicted transcriptional regulator